MTSTKPGEWVMQALLRQLTNVAQLKIEKALGDGQETNLVKSMKLNEDTAYEHLISAFGVAAEFALPSILSTLSLWYRSQHSSGRYYQLHQFQSLSSANEYIGKVTSMAVQRPLANDSNHVVESQQVSYLAANKSEKTIKCASESSSLSKSHNLPLPELSLAIDIIFCHVMLAVLKQLPFHPGHNDVIESILEQCFGRFNYREDLQPKNSENINLVADLYAEIVGLLFQSRFALVRHKFMSCLNDLRSKENSQNNRASIVSLIMGMKFFRVKMHPIEDFVKCFTFLQELGQYYLEVKEIEIKHVLSDLFVEILLPVAAVARQEVNIPALKTFVENLYPTSLELANKKKHIPALFPLVTCLLCVGTKSFFLNNWTNFLSICLSHLKNRTSKVALVSLQSLSCILWVYIVRIKGEKHTETQTKLHTIINSLFPKNQKIILPKDAPINIFVRIIQFIAHEKLEFAMKEVIIERLGVNGLQKTLVMPERINVGICAFLLIAHGLQQKEGEPPMPQQCIGAGGVGGGFRQAVIKRSFHGTNLNEALGSLLGIQSYLVPVRRAFEHILRQLDTQVCRPMMLPKQEVTQKEFDELMTADRKPKLDLLKTCVACIPRLLPIDMTKQEILEILAKVCLHVDEDVRKMAQQAMANLIVELPAYRVKTIQVFIQFIQKNVADTSPHQLDSCLKTLFHLLNNWKLALQKDGAVTPNMSEKSALYEAEGFALVMLCSCRLITRRLSVHILRKCRALSNLIQSATYDQTLKNPNDSRELCCIDILDRSVPIILKHVLPILPLSERSALSSVSNMDFSVFTERSHPVWFSGSTPPVYSPVVLPANYLNNTQYSGLMSNNDVQQRCRICPNLHLPRLLTGLTEVRPQVSGLLIPSKSFDFRNIQTSKSYLSTTPVHRRASQYNQQIQHTQQAYIMQPIQERVAVTDVWATCLSIVFNSSNLPTSCPMAIKSAWSILFQRINTIFPLIDPSAQMAENRASSLLRTGSKKPANEREQFIPLWHNYVVVGCCIAPSSTGLRISKSPDTRYQPGFHLQKHSPDFPTKGDSNDCDNNRSPTQSDEVVNQTIDLNANSSSNRPVVSNSSCTNWSNSPDLKYSTSFGKVNARDLIKLLVPLLRCEQPEIRDSAIGGLGRINPAAFRDVLEDLQPLLKESFDRKQENLRRRRRRDGLRSALVKTLSLMAQTGVFAYPESNIVTPQGSLICQLLDYMDGMRGYLESVSDQLLSPINYTHQLCTSLNLLVPIPSGSTSQQVTAVGSISSNHQGGGSISANSVIASLSTPTTTGPSLTSYSSEFYLLGEIRLHFCIFIKELIRRLPKQSRTALLPPTLRHQLFILLSHWSAHFDHIMGTYLGSEGPVLTESYSLDSNENIVGQPSSLNGIVGFSPSNEIPYGIFGIHHQLSNDNFLQSLNSLGVNSAPSSGSIECNANMSVSSGQTSQSPTIQQKTCEGEQIDRIESVEYCLWIDLIWLSNQAMAALVCCGAIFDRSALLPQDSGKLNQIILGVGSDASSFPGPERLNSGSGSNVRTPSSGYVLRWISGLLVARDTALSSSPWLWFCPITGRGLLHSTLTPGGASLCGNSHTRSRTIAAGGGRRLDSLLRQLGEETLVLMLDFNSDNTCLFNWPGEILFKQAHPTEIDKSFVPNEAANSQSSPNLCIPGGCDCSQLCKYLQINKLFYHSFNRWSPCEVVRQFSAQHPEFTLTIFSEVSKRLENAREGLRITLLHLLSIWLVNVELVDLVEGDLFDATNHSMDKDDDDFSDIDKDSFVCPSNNLEKSGNLPESVGIPTFKAYNTTNLLDTSEQQQRKDCSDYRTRPSKRYKCSKNFLNSESLYDHEDADADSDNIVNDRNFKSLTLLRMRARQTMVDEHADIYSPRACHLHNHFKKNGCKYNTNTNNNELHWSTVPPTLRSRGWGSKKATEFVLTNLFYLSLRLADCPTSSEVIKQLWLTLIRYRSTNLRVILRYLIIITSIAPGTLLVHVKRLLTYLASEQAERVIGELIVEMQTIDGIGLVVEPISSLPFFRVSTSTQHQHHRQSIEKLKSPKFQSCVPNNSLSNTVNNSSQRVNDSLLANQEGIGQPDDELVALGLGSKPCSNTTAQVRTLHSAIGGSYDYHSIDYNLSVKSPSSNVTVRTKSATCQPSTVTISTNRPDHNYLKCFTKCGSNLDDKYATLRAKDIANLLTLPNSKDFQSSDSDSNCDIPNLYRRGTTFPIVSDAYERSVFSSTLSNPLNETNCLPTTGRISRQPKYFREYKEKRSRWSNNSKVDAVESLRLDPFHHSASLPPSLAALPPLPLPLPASISSILSLSSRGSTGSNTCILSISPVTVDRKSTTSSDKSDIKPCVRRISNVEVSHSSNKSYFDYNSKPLPMPANGGYHAPLSLWLSEPLVIGGSVVFSGSWPPAGPRAPLVLILAGSLTQSRDIHVNWSEHLPLMLLGVFLGIDHCRALVQEESKHLLVSLLDQVCPHHDILRLLRLELEANLHRLAYPSGFPGPRVQDYRLTLDGGPYREKFSMVINPFDSIERDQLFPSPLVSCTTTKHDGNSNFKNRSPAEDEETLQTTSSDLIPLKDINVTTSSAASPSSPSISPPIVENFQTHPTLLTNQGRLSGSMFSLTSTATLIPRHHESNLFESQGCNDSSISKRNSVCYNLTSNSSEKEFLRNKTLTSAVRPSSVYSKSRSSKNVASNCVPFNNHCSLKVEKTKRIKKSDLKLLEEAVQQLKSLLLNSSGQAIWTWEDFNIQHNSFSTTFQYYQNEIHQIINNEKVENKESVIKPMTNVNPLEQLVKLVARILALSEAGSEQAENCLQCLHGPPHNHNSQSLTFADDDYKDTIIDHSNYCMVARLSRIALNTGLSCPSRHLASRSLQIHRALGGHLDKKSFSQLLARLGETVSDGSEEIQGYVAELFLTQEAAIHHLKSKSDSLLESVSYLTSESTSPSSSSLNGNGRKSVQNIVSISDRRHFHRHSKSSSLIGNRPCHLSSVMPINDCGLSKLAQSTSPNLEYASPTSSFPSDSNHLSKISGTSNTSTPKPNNNNTNNVCLLPPEERADLIIGIFWTGVLLLESDFEHEYLVGLKLLNLVIPSVCASNLGQSSDGSKINLSDRAQKMLNQLQWNPCFPGILSLVIKGCSSPNLVDQSCRLLVLLIPFLTHPLIVPTGRMGLSNQLSFPIVLLTLMPMLVTAWDEDPSTSVPLNPYDTNAEQLSFLQGGFLGRGVCGSLSVIPRALGSWTSCFCTSYTSYTNPNIASNSKLRTDSIGLFANCPSNSLGTFSAHESTSNLNAIATGSTTRDTLLNSKSPILRPKNPICIQAAESLAQAALKTDPIQFTNLALILRLYASGSFSKDVDQWSRCVICYLLEGCSSNISRLLKHINMLLTSGPPCLQLPLLKVAHLFLQQVDINQRDMEYSLQNFITSIVNQFIGTCLWTHVLPILQVTVSRSAVLNSVPETPAYSLPGLDPSGSGRVLDYAIASAAVAVPLPDSEPPRLELGGPVLDFTFNVLQEAPLLAPQYAPITSSHSTSDNISKVDIPTFDHTSSSKGTKKDFIDVSDIGLTEIFVSASSGWNKPGNSQIRLREKLYCLVSCYGLPPQQCISAPRSPSVIFSQSTETLDPQLSIHSSSETTSVVDISNSDDIHLDDTSSGEQTAVFRDLDTYLDAQLMNINFLGVPDCRLASTNASMSEEEPRRPWGVRGQAITCHFDFNGDGNESVANESVGGLSRTVQLTDKTTSSLAYSNTKSDYFTAAYQHHHSEKEHQNRTHSLPHLTCVTNNLSDMKDTESNSSSTNRYSTITISNNYTDDNVDDRYSSASYSEQQQPLPQSEYKKPSTSLAWRSFAKEKSNFRDNDLMNDEFTGKERFNEDMQVVKYPLVTVRNSRSERVTFNLDGDKNEYDEVGRQDDAHRKNKISMDDGMEKINDRCMPKSCKGILINRSNHDYVKGLQHNELFQSDTVLVDNSRMRSASTQSLNNDGNYNETNNSNQNLRSRIYFPRCMSSNRNEVRAKYINHDLLTNEPKQAVDNHHYHDHFSVNTPQKHLVGQIKRSLSTSELLLTRQHFTLNNKSNDYKSLTNSTVFSPLTYRNKVSYHVNDKYFTSFSSSLSSTRSLSPVNRHNQFEQMAFNLIDTNDKDHFNSNDNNTDLSKTISCRPNSLCSSSVLPQSIPPSLSPMLTAPSGVSVHSSHLSLHCIEMIRKSSDLPVIPRKHKATSDSHLNCFNKQILCNHQKLHQSNSHHRCYHFSYVNESTHSVNSSECTSLNKIVSVQPIQRLCNWKYPLITEQKWIALEPLSNSTCLHLNEQQKLISLLMELPQLYQELISRYINAINDTIDLSVCCWTKSSQMDRLGKLVEKMKTYLRPPWFFCRLCQDDLTETVHSYLISNVSHLLEKHQEIQKQFEKLYNLLQSENTRDTFIQLFSNMFTNVIEFVKYSYSSVEIMCANLSMLKKNEVLLPAILDRSCCFQYLLKCILSGLDLTNDINNHDDNSDVPIKPAICNEPAALKNQLCEFLANMLASFPNDELLTSINQFNPENCKQIIRLYKQLSHKSLDASEVPIDMVINILNIFANHVWESDSTSYIAYLPLPALDKDINDQLDTINYCAHLTVSLHHLVLNDNVNDDGKLC
ncbi:putative heat containing protein [Schistosoma mansoni]|uniref:putative heat containing protein n=1 Tax=Schistosoma mansoni TaxID=6183 RepID=UPI00022DD110|nr:putative heat containing protein [Schistosoma mansoni]|eukprot:XP_018654082.1 putative heat containing protein [Schistosoma mansoni]